MLKLKIGGVPEHFNYPWLHAINHNLFNHANYQLQFQFQKGGTGEMIEELENKNLDLAIMLTEGAIFKINKGTNFRILQKYVETPLLWGIHVAANSSYRKISDLESSTIAISRYGSGSHLMAVVNAKLNNWDISKLNYKVCDNLDNAVSSLENKTSDYLMWEHFTTKPLVDLGILRRLDDCPTPWPCFVIVCRESIYQTYPEEIKHLQEKLHHSIKTLRNDNFLAKKIASKFNQKIDDVKQWIKITEWSDQQQLTIAEINQVQHQLKELNLLDSILNYENFILS